MNDVCYFTKEVFRRNPLAFIWNSYSMVASLTSLTVIDPP